MVSCVAYGCTNRSTKKIQGITFHCFPKDKKRRAAWIKAIRRDNWTPSNTSRLCSVHFSEDQIDRTSLSNVRLKEDATPNVFKAFPSYFERIHKSRKLPANRGSSNLHFYTESDSQPSRLNDEVLASNETSIFDISTASSCSPTKTELKRKVAESEEKVERFPEKEKQRAAWISAVRRKDWKPTKYSRLCSEHFTKESFYRMSPCRVYLRENTVPSVFKAFPACMQSQSKARKRSAKREEEVQEREEEESEGQEVEEREVEDVEEREVEDAEGREVEDVEDAEGREEKEVEEFISVSFEPVTSTTPDPMVCIENNHYKRKWEQATAVYRKKLRRLQQINRRQKRRIITLKSIIDKLKDQRLKNADMFVVCIQNDMPKEKTVIF